MTNPSNDLAAGRPADGLAHCLAEWADALDGFPVRPLIDLLDEQEEGDQARQLVGHLLTTWETQLARDIERAPGAMTDVLARGRRQLQVTRHALSRLRDELEDRGDRAAHQPAHQPARALA